MVYIEACESGSMFEETLPSSLGVWALTAAKVQWPLAGRVPCD